MTRHTKARDCTPAEDAYYAQLDKDKEVVRQKRRYAKQFDGSYEASRGDYEGACLARAEYEAGQIS